MNLQALHSGWARDVSPCSLLGIEEAPQSLWFAFIWLPKTIFKTSFTFSEPGNCYISEAAGLVCGKQCNSLPPAASRLEGQASLLHCCTTSGRCSSNSTLLILLHLTPDKFILYSPFLVCLDSDNKITIFFKLEYWFLNVATQPWQRREHYYSNTSVLGFNSNSWLWSG